VRDIIISAPISKDFIFYLSRLGKLFYHDELEKPYFRIIVRGKMTIKGAETNKTVRVLMPDEPDEAEFDALKQHIIDYVKES
jgi:hypothetical protein